MEGKQEQTTQMFHSETPIFESLPLSKLAGKHVFLKMDCFQEGGSFKVRGLGKLCSSLSKEKNTNHFICSSGGNAGYAVSFIGRKMETKVTIFVPTSTKQVSIDAMEREGATVIVHGAVWDEAHAKALEFVEQNPTAAYIHPFDNPVIWQGHASIIEECRRQMKEAPDCIVLSVGGGGLLSGIIEGLHSSKDSWANVPILAVETEGAASLHEALKADKLVTLDSITTVATTLGARRVCGQAFELSKNHPVHSVLVTDEQAVEACKLFARDHRCLVEPSCAASLSVVYNGLPVLAPYKRVLVIVCGGIGVNVEYSY